MRGFSLISALTLTVFIANCLNAQNEKAGEQSETTSTSAIKTDLTDHDKQLLKLRLQHLFEKDQQFRSYSSYGTTDDSEIQRLKKLSLREQFAAMAKNRKKLSFEIKQLLQKLQRKNDRENLNEFIALVKKYGYPSPERVGTDFDRCLVLLLHPPVAKDQIENHTAKMCQLLKPEVLAGRMKPRSYAMFVDNMRGKILRKPQLYGTNKSFNPKTGKIEPPLIRDIAETNQARREIGLPILEDGEYRIGNEKAK